MIIVVFSSLEFYANLVDSQILLLVFGIIAIMLCLALILAFLIIKLTKSRRYRNSFGNRIYRLAMDNDYYLVHEFSFPTDEENHILIDHILFGDHYIYCISDKYYEGVIDGEQHDQSWIFYPKGLSDKKEVIPNPLLANKKRIDKLALLTGADRNFFISIVLFNNECYLEDVQIKSRDEYIRNIKELPRLVEAIEKRPIEKINPEALKKAVNDIATLRDKYSKKTK